MLLVLTLIHIDKFSLRQKGIIRCTQNKEKKSASRSQKKKRLVLHYWLWTYFALDSDNKIFFSNCEKYVVLRTGENCWAKCFYSYSPNINLPKDEFSRQRFKNISWTLNLSQKIFFLATLTPSSFTDFKYIEVYPSSWAFELLTFKFFYMLDPLKTRC